LFLYNGTELDSGTVVEFMFSKFADIPSVIVRTDFRKRRRFQFAVEFDEQLFPAYGDFADSQHVGYQGFLKGGKTPWEASSLLAQHIARSLC
jgi:hypothetical protein